MKPSYENYIERIVREELENSFKDDTTLCRCENCYQDIPNDLLPRYLFGCCYHKDHPLSASYNSGQQKTAHTETAHLR